MQTDKLHSIFLKQKKVSTDTRNITKNSIFFALKGANFDGNAYASEALAKGAAYAVIDNIKHKTSDKFILVKNVLQSLQELANYHRKYYKTPVVGITGSNGKTTTKELLNAVLSSSYNTIATKGNLNNHIGVPLSLLEIKEDTEIAIIEMGANHPNEIEALCNIAEPDYGLITNIGIAHIEGFGSFEGVKKTKGELYDHLIANNKKIIYNRDNPILEELLGKRTTNVHSYGRENTANTMGKIISIDKNLMINVLNTEIKTQLVGDYNFENVMAAISFGLIFNIEIEKIKSSIEAYSPSNNRSQYKKTKKNYLILDMYNANPSSMKVALDNFIQINSNQKAVILGDMLELGNTAKAEHSKIIRQLENSNISKCYLIGNAFIDAKNDDSRFTFHKSTEELIQHADFNLLQDFTILIKGSRGIQLEKIVEYL